MRVKADNNLCRFLRSMISLIIAELLKLVCDYSNSELVDINLDYCELELNSDT